MLTRRRFLSSGVAIALGAVLAACDATLRSMSATRQPASATIVPAGSATESPRASPRASPALRDLIGQMLLVGFRGATPETAAATVRDITERGLGGVLLFSVDQSTGGERNVISAAQLSELVNALSAASSIPLIVAIDQEGGKVARLGPTHGFPATPSAAQMGRGSVDDTRALATVMAQTEASVGVTLNLAPVVDLAVNPSNPAIAELDRSFGADAQVVVDHARAFIEGHHDRGVRCAIKHFPGQGSASGDTHLGVVDVTSDWTERELEPFADLVADGSADAVLTAHIFNANLDREHPATLSRATITGILRERMGFEGPIISDDLQMGAIVDAYGYPEAVALALEAGVDLLLIANQRVYQPTIVADTIDIIERLVLDGRIPAERIHAAVERIASLR